MARAPLGTKSDNVSDLAAAATPPNDPARVSDPAPAATGEADTVKSDNVSDLVIAAALIDERPASWVCCIPVLHDGRRYAAGDPIPLTPEQAAPLAVLGAIDPEA